MTVRPYEQRDAAAIAALFYDTVRTVNAKDYSAEQLRVWAPSVPDAAQWHRRMAGRHTLVVEKAGKIMAFAELEENGYLDMFYCASDAQRRGIGARLFAAVLDRAQELGVARIFTDASITARPFFERQGFTVTRENVIERDGVSLINFTMERLLP